MTLSKTIQTVSIILLFGLTNCKETGDIAESYLTGLKEENAYIWLEAEAPESIATHSFHILNSESAFGGKLIEKPEGTASWTFDLPADDNYKFIGRVYAKNGNADSWQFSLSNDNGNKMIRDVWNNINVDKRLSWEWDEMTTGRTNNETFWPYLESGTYTLAFHARDADDCMIDKLIITNDSLYDSGDLERSTDKTYLDIEAETGQIEAPFKSGSDNASIEYVWVEKANAIYPFKIEKSGKYMVWGYVYGENGHSDSVFGIVDDQPQKIWAFGGEEEWGKWNWVLFTDNSNEGGFHGFGEGIHQLVIHQREGGAKIDAILVTDDIEYAPINKPRKQ